MNKGIIYKIEVDKVLHYYIINLNTKGFPDAANDILEIK